MTRFNKAARSQEMRMVRYVIMVREASARRRSTSSRRRLSR